MGKKNKKGKKNDKKTPAWKSYLKITSGKSWKSNKDRKEADKFWNNSAKRQRSPAAAKAHDARSQAYKDNRANNKIQKNQKKGGSGSQSTDRMSGNFDDIRNALAMDAATGRQAARNLANQSVPTGTSSVITNLQDLLGLGLPGTAPAPAPTPTPTPTPAPATGTAPAPAPAPGGGATPAPAPGGGATPAPAPAISQDIQNILDTYQQTINNLTSTNSSTINDMQDQLNDAIKNLNNAANNPTNTALQNQLTAANAALAAASKKQNQMAKAFVPQANPNALVSAGTTNSANSSARPAQSNQLSDLTILSGLGTTSNPLAGLQLA